MAIQKNLKGKRAVITGASSGIGAEFARQLAAAGADLVIAARRLDRLEKLASELKAKHDVRVECVRADLNSPDAPKALFDAATADGAQVDILINNAGHGPFGRFLTHGLDKHVSSIQVNCTSLTALTYLFAEHMLAHGNPAWISNVGSIASFQATGNYVVYSATKQFVRAFSEALSHELRESNVHVHCLCPGGTYTEFMEANGQQLTEAADSVMMSAEKVVETGLRSMLRGETCVVPGFVNKLACFLPRFVPRGMAMSVGTKALERNARPADAPAGPAGSAATPES